MARRIAVASTLGFTLVMLIAFACTAHAEGVIGQDSVFTFPVATFITTTNPDEQAGAQIFNYFASLEVFIAIVACWIRMTLNVLKREVL